MNEGLRLRDAWEIGIIALAPLRLDFLQVRLEAEESSWTTCVMSIVIQI